MSKGENIKLNNGYEIPPIGIGTYSCAILPKIVKHSIDTGYRLFDTAYSYMNEDEIGNSIKDKIKDGTIKREDVFVITKLWNTKHKPEKVLKHAQKSLENFGLEYIDLYLVHWPTACKRVSYKHEVFLLNEEDKGVTIEKTWLAMEEVVKQGYAKSIGLSNFNSEQIDRILKVATIKPVANQVEVNPYINNKKLIKFCKDRGIVVIAYSPFFAPHRRESVDHGLRLLNEPVLKQVAKKHKKTAAQVVLRYLVQIGTVPIPKSSYHPHVDDNFNIFDFTLDDHDIKEVETLNCGLRCTPYLNTKHFKEYPFNIEF